MFRKLFMRVLVPTLVMCLLMTAYATEAEDISGEGEGVSCGEEMSWMVDGTVLTISGKGEMFDFEDGAPWADFKDTLTKVILDGNIETVGAYAFQDYDKLTEVEFGSSLVRIGVRAFAGCDGLTKISLPKTFKKFGEESFRSCVNLKEIHCSGNFPRFDTSCLWDVHCTIYYPAEAPWSVIYIEQLETAFQNRIEFLDSNGKDHYTPTEPAEETEPETTETAPPTETTEPAAVPTETETVPAAVPVETEAPATVPETEAETEPETVTEETFLMGTKATEPEPTEPREHRRGGMIGLAIVGLTLSAVGLGALAYHNANKRRLER